MKNLNATTLILLSLMMASSLLGATDSEEAVAYYETCNLYAENKALAGRNNLLSELLLRAEQREATKDLTISLLKSKITLNEETIIMQQKLLSYMPERRVIVMATKMQAIKKEARNFGANPSELIDMIKNIKRFEEGTIIHSLLMAVVRNLAKQGYSISKEDTIESIKKERINNEKTSKRIVR